MVIVGGEPGGCGVPGGARHTGRGSRRAPRLYRGGTHLPGIQINETDGLTRLRRLSPCRRTQGRTTRQIRNSKRPLIMTT